jgi:3-oxoacyl-[acyl-carrier protein] reductase
MNYSVPISISDKILQDFVLLTKDSSSLHTNSKFARKSMYRENVIHGMLPLSFISILPSKIGLKYFSFKSISASFLKPIFIGESLIMNFVIESFHPSQLEYEVNFSIVNELSGVVYTTGIFIIESKNIEDEKNNEENVGDNLSMIKDSLVEKNLRFDEIKKNDFDLFEFQISKESINFFFQIIENGSGIDIGSQYISGYNNLLTVCLFSTFVGICMPGQNATFIDFNVIIPNKIKLFKKYIFRGEVSFKSKSTDVLVLGISVTDKDLGVNLLTGKIKTKVNEASKKMPSMRDFKVDGFGLNNKVVLITGASGGIGETTAKLFSLYGAIVVINYFKGQDEASRIVDEIKINGGIALAIKADISEKEQVKSMFDEVISKYKTIDILVNNAVSKNLPQSFLNVTWDDFQHDININIKGVFNCCQEALPYMIKCRKGKIVNMGTVYTEVPVPNQAKYISTKSAIVGLTRSLAIEMAAYNIQVNMVCPSIVETDLTKHIPKMFFTKTISETPLKRLASTIDVANAIIFLSSTLSDFTTGQKIMVTGGNAPFL